MNQTPGISEAKCLGISHQITSAKKEKAPIVVILEAPGIKRQMTIFTKWLTSRCRRTVDRHYEKELSVLCCLWPAQEVAIGFVGSCVSFLDPLHGVQQKDSGDQSMEKIWAWCLPNQSPRGWHLISKFHVGDEFDVLMFLARLTLMH